MKQNEYLEAIRRLSESKRGVDGAILRKNKGPGAPEWLSQSSV